VQLGADRHDSSIDSHHRFHHIAKLTIGDGLEISAGYRCADDCRIGLEASS
jgi:hypothetical protein